MNAYLRRNKITILALLTVLVDYFVCIITSPMVFHTNDDFIIDFALSKARLGETWWLPTFIDSKLGYIIGAFYVLKNISWWFYFQHSLIIISVFAINYTLIKTLSNKMIPFKFYMCVVLLLNCCLFWRWISYVAFTMTPAICIASVISVILSYGLCGERRKYVFFLIFTLLVYYIALMIRRDSAVAGLPFLILAFFIKSSKDNGFTIKSWLRVGGIAFIFILLTFLNIHSRRFLLEQINGKEFIEFNDARIDYTDYYHDSYGKNPKMYEAVGWDEEMAGLLWNFCMEEKGTDELLYAKSNSEVLSKRVIVINSVQDIARDRNICILLLCAICISFLGAIAILLKKRYNNLLYYVFNNGGGALLLSYLLLQGRINLRSINVIILPLCIINIYLSIDSIEVVELKKQNGNNIALLILTITLLVVCSLLSENRRLYANAIYAKGEREHLWWSEYVNEHSNNVYIEETGQGSTHTTPRGRINANNFNYSNTGDADWNCAARRQFCIINDFEKGFLPYIFEKENVYYVTKMDSGIIPPYLLYMMKHHRAIGVAVVDRSDVVEGLCITHFVYDFNKTEYSEYYTIDDNILVHVSNL